MSDNYKENSYNYKNHAFLEYMPKKYEVTDISAKELKKLTKEKIKSKILLGYYFGSLKLTNWLNKIKRLKLNGK